MQLELWLSFVVASALIIAVPGPIVLLVIARTVERGPASAVPVLLGSLPGAVVGMSLSFAGLGAVLAASAELFTLVKWLGAAYLVYLGVSQWRRSRRAAAAARRGSRAGPASGGRGAVWQGFLVSTLNPKAIIFYVAFIPQFMDPHAPALPQMLILGATFVTLLPPVLGCYVAAAALLRRGIRSERAMGVLNRVGAATMVGAGVLTASLRGAQGATPRLALTPG